MISDLLDFLKIEIQCREKNEHLTKEFNSYDSNPRKETRNYYNEKQNYKHSKFNKYNVDSAYGKNKNTYVPTTSAFVVNVNKCVFCLGNDNKNDHSSDSCPKSIEERKLSLRKNGICYLCLTRGHIFRACKKARVCVNCKGRHSELICDTSFIPTNNPVDQKTSSENAGVRVSSLQCDTPLKSISCCNVNTTPNEILLETCRALLVNESEKKEINLLLDNASQRCFFKKTVASEMKLPVKREENLLVYTFDSRNSHSKKKYEVVEITLCNLNDSVNTITMEALLTDVISGTPFKISANKLKKSLSCKNVHFSDLNESNGDEISLLIGAQYFWQIHSGKKEKLTKTLFAIDTILGTIIQGRISLMDVHYKENVSVFKIECCSQLNENLTQFWKLESMGISDTEKNRLDSDNDYISSFENNLKFNNGMYETKLFWEDKPSDLENNWAIAKRRFGNLSLKMQDNNWLYNEYKNIVKDKIKENIVEECSSHFETNFYYMPHSAVVRKDKETTKVRMVFDASSKVRDYKCLNECLYAGPPLNPRIIDVLLRFREYEHAFCSDI
ncbi:DUF1758 domain-containing protein [Trichonephila clavipes]|nr:DUF1758 domain-containing protein [Trichonephila clavipes]